MKKKINLNLSNEQKIVLFEEGTEPPGSSELNHEKREGTYHCVNCDAKLFSSSTKYDSGSGWPSFYDAINHKSIKQIKDESMGMIRIEIRCSNCDAHLGHVFPDGPAPTGQRYCVNSLSMTFKGEDNVEVKG